MSVPVIRAHDRQHLDLKDCEAGETTVPIDPIQDPENSHKWGDCILPQTSTLSGKARFIKFQVLKL